MDIETEYLISDTHINFIDLIFQYTEKIYNFFYAYAEYCIDHNMV